MNGYVEWELARQRLAEARSWAKVEACLRNLNVEPRPLRVSVGLGLVRLGRWLAYQPDPVTRRVAA